MRSMLKVWRTSNRTNTTRSKLFLKDLITLGHADGDYSEPERQMVREIAAQLNISEDALQLLEQAVDSLIKASVLMNTALYS